MSNENKDLIPQEEPTAIDTGEAILTERYVEEAGKQIALRSKLLMTALKALKPHDLQDFDGKPYLEGEGAARIMAVIRGFKVGEAKFTVEQIAPHYFVECAIPIEFKGATTVAIGDCSTQDSFFTGKDGQSGRYGKYVTQTGSEVMATRLLLGDAKKKARENAISRGVSELLGIKGLSWQDLEQLGLKRGEAGASISFKTGSQGGEIKTLSVTGAKILAKGSVVNIQGQLVNAKERSISGGKTITDYYLTEGNIQIRISKWGSCVEGLKANDPIFASEVTIGEYNGTPTYLAREISRVESGVPNGNAE